MLPSHTTKAQQLFGRLIAFFDICFARWCSIGYLAPALYVFSPSTYYYRLSVTPYTLHLTACFRAKIFSFFNDDVGCKLLT